jgi:hypothetical protein
VFEKQSGNADPKVKNAAALALLSLAPDRVKTERLPELVKCSDESLRQAARKLLADRSVALSSTVGKVKVEILSGRIGTLEFIRRTGNGPKQLETPDKLLVLKARVTNMDDIALVKYAPWHAGREKAARPSAKDQDEKALSPWFAGVASWPLDGVQAARKIDPEKSIVEIVAFSAPSPSAYEIDVKLPADNVGVPGQWFKFKIVRPFLEKNK